MSLRRELEAMLKQARDVGELEAQGLESMHQAAREQWCARYDHAHAEITGLIDLFRAMEEAGFEFGLLRKAD